MIKRLIISAFLAAMAISAPAQQLYNLSFDQWSKKGGCWNPYAQDAKNPTWDTANHGLSVLGINGTVPEYEHLAVKGSGKAAVKIQTKKILGILVAGNIYTGKFLNLVRMSGARISFGIPFTGRPKSLSGYVHYIPGKIDIADKKMAHLKGTTDIGRVDIKLTDTGDVEIIDSTDKNFHKDPDHHAPGIVAFGEALFKEDTKGYIYFEIPIIYNNDNTPTHITITATSSRYAQTFTGSTDSVMYLDEFHLNY